MAAPLVTIEDVFTAANDLKAAGQKVSILNIHKIVGRGSFTTISNFLRKWEGENKHEPLAQELVIPEVFAGESEMFIRKLWKMAMDSAEVLVQGERDLLRAREAEINQELESTSLS